MKKTLLAFAVAVPLLGLLPGCASRHLGAYEPLDANATTLENTARFVLLDKGAQQSVTCVGLQETRLADGRYQIVANLLNRENRRLQVQANCVFKDAQGFPVEDTPFQNVFLDENAQEGVKFTSANDKAQRYTVRVREAR
ncbi:MAG TPA: DUF1425 domain-containing protein [Verrucomicrobiae bacterium]